MHPASISEVATTSRLFTLGLNAVFRDQFGWKLAARAWNLGLFQSTFKAFVGDGSDWIWTIFEKHSQLGESAESWIMDDRLQQQVLAFVEQLSVQKRSGWRRERLWKSRI